jgi:DNA-binding XRE family transcriptional regulator
MWCLIGSGRQTALAEKAGISRQALCLKLKKMNYDDFIELINEIEGSEMFSIKDSQNLVLKCAKYLMSEDHDLAKFCEGELMKWSKIYSSLMCPNQSAPVPFDKQVDAYQRRNKALGLLSKLTKMNQINLLSLIGFSKEKSYVIRSGKTAPSWDEIDLIQEKIIAIWGEA